MGEQVWNLHGLCGISGLHEVDGSNKKGLFTRKDLAKLAAHYSSVGRTFQFEYKNRRMNMDGNQVSLAG